MSVGLDEGSPLGQSAVRWRHRGQKFMRKNEKTEEIIEADHYTPNPITLTLTPPGFR